MHKLYKLLSLLILVLVSDGLLHAESEIRTFANPVFAHDWADPTVWKGDDSLYYSFSTAGTIYSEKRGKFLYSTDMVSWDTIPDYVWTKETLTQLEKYGSNFWAPQVTRIDGKWLMYLTCYNSSAKDPSIVVLSLDAETFPTESGLHGPWQFESVLTRSTQNKIKDSIDPFVVQDPETGKIWMFFGSTGGNYRVELAQDGLSIADKAEYIHVAGLTDDEDNSREKVFEGAYLHYHNGYWYYFVSSGFFSDYTYALKVGRSESLTGNFVDKDGNFMTKGYATKILSTPSSNKELWGPGHNAEIFTDLEDRSYIFYHCHGKNVPITVAGYNPRALMLQQIYWGEDGWPYFENDTPLAEETWPATTNSFYDLIIPEDEWTTLYLPFAFRIPAGMSVYSINGIDEQKLVIKEIHKTQANTAYLIHAKEGTYPLNGYASDTIDSQANGLLVGTQDMIIAPMGSYVLQKQTEGLGFYKISDDSTPIIESHRAYLQLPEQGESSTRDFFLIDEATGLETVGMNRQIEIETVISISGQRIKMQSEGFRIIRYSDGTVKKSIIIK